MTTTLSNLPQPAGRWSRRGALSAAMLALALASVMPGTARAHRPKPDFDWIRMSRVSGGLVDVEVRVDGDRVPLFSSPRFSDRRYFEAERGRNYALALHNRTGRRIGVLIAVDGLNVVNGEISSLGHGEPMYVLDPYQSTTIRGWRTSLEQVQQFVFVDEARSYATRSGQANGDMGWIRVLAFEEQPPVAILPPAESAPWIGRDESRGAGEAVEGRDRASKEAQASEPAGKPLAAMPEAYAGTGWGSRRHDPVRQVEFDAAPLASDHLVLRYEYASALAALGIYPDDDRLWEREQGEIGFARPPRW